MPSLDAPVPTSATWLPLGPQTVVDWSVPITPGSLDAGNWTARYNDTWHIGSGVTAAGGNLLVMWAVSGPNVGPDVVNYAPPPFDVISIGGSVPAPAFADFPVT